jgi:hypothetical protein
MGDLCGRIVERFGDWWDWTGWAAFAAWYFGPLFLVLQGDGETASVAGLMMLVLWLLMTPLLLVWWVVDAIDRQAPWYALPVSLTAMLLGCVSPTGGLLVIAPFVLYMTRWRE